MRYPKNLEKGNTIGFVAPSFGAVIYPYNYLFINALKVLEEKGYKTKVGSNCYENKGVGISNTPKACGDELTNFYLDNESDVVISVGGGECMCEILDYVDFDKIKKADPKWFLGYSDNTNFSFLLNTICDTASVYGNNACDFGAVPMHKAVQDTLDVLCGKTHVENYELWERSSIKDPENPLLGYNCTEKECHFVYADGQKQSGVHLEGRILAGCIDVMEILSGTKFDKVPEFIEKYKEDGILWFFDACDLGPIDLRRCLWRLEHCGWFKYVNGFVFGRPYRYGEDQIGVTHTSAAIDMLSKYNVPMVFDIDFGHLQPAMPIISGSYGKMDVDEKVKIDFELK